MSEERVKSAMEIILAAGDARTKSAEALEALVEFDVEKAKELLSEAHKEIVKAHIVQTEVIQSEMNDDISEYSLLFAHAQDTLMTIYSEINITKHLINIFEALNQRISKLENK